jgi:hypothetical protein
MERWRETARPLSEHDSVEIVGRSFNEHGVVWWSGAGYGNLAAVEEAYRTNPDGHAGDRDPDLLVDAMRSRLRGPVLS